MQEMQERGEENPWGDPYTPGVGDHQARGSHARVPRRSHPDCGGGSARAARRWRRGARREERSVPDHATAPVAIARARTDAVAEAAGTRSVGAVITSLGRSEAALDGAPHVAEAADAPELSVLGAARPAVADLVGQVLHAEATVAEARGDALPAPAALLGDMARALSTEPLAHESADAYARRTAAAAEKVLARAARGTDVGAIVAAGRDVAAAVDRALPALQARADALTPSSARAPAACDVVDQAPVLCVGGEGVNAHSNAFKVVIDLGGNDDYTLRIHNLVTATDGAVVTVDLGGDDRYRGSAYGYAGVGITVDTAGNDRYEQALAVTATGAHDPGHGVGLGMGILGMAALWDGRGDDTYTMHAESHGQTQLIGMAVAWGGVGALVDLGSGKDAFSSSLVRHRGRTDPERFGATGITTQGFAVGAGVGVPVVPAGALLYDDGGPGQHDVNVETDNLGSMSVFSQAAAMPRGEALVVTGPGDTHYSVSVSHRLTSAMLTYGQGYANDGRGVLRDLGGDDRYVMLGHGSYTSQASSEDGDAAAEMAQPFPFPGRSVFAQGSVAGIGGEGMLLDDVGNDAYRAAADLRYEAEAATVPRPAGTPAGRARAVAISPSVTVQAQGATAGGIVAYTAALLADAAGDDAFEALGTVSAVARARAASADLAHSEARIGGDIPQVSNVFAQGSGGGGALLDGGGSNTFRVVNRSIAESFPAAHLGKAAPVEVRVHGAQLGVLLDAGDSVDVHGRAGLRRGNGPVRRRQRDDRHRMVPGLHDAGEGAGRPDARDCAAAGRGAAEPTCVQPRRLHGRPPAQGREPPLRRRGLRRPEARPQRRCCHAARRRWGARDRRAGDRGAAQADRLLRATAGPEPTALPADPRPAAHRDCFQRHRRGGAGQPRRHGSGSGRRPRPGCRGRRRRAAPQRDRDDRRSRRAVVTGGPSSHGSCQSPASAAHSVRARPRRRARYPPRT